MITTTPVDAYRIEELDVRHASDEVLRPVAELLLAWRRETTPEDPLPPLEAILQRLRAIPDVARPAAFVAVAPDGAAAAQAVIWRYDVPENRGHREVDLRVRADHRGRGLGRELFARLVAAAGEGAEMLTSYTNDRVPAGEAFARRLGAKPGLVNRTSQLDLTSLDRAMVREWAAIHPSGYRLEWITETYTPERLVPNVIVAYDTMNTAPHDDLEQEDWKTTPALLRDFEKTGEARGTERRLLLAIEHATGATAGFTEVGYDARVPTIVGQEGTAVVPAHRGRGIGKWIKARMLEHVLAEWPAARYVRTGNAYSNAPMLSINDRLGFKVVWSITIWQLPIADARRYAAV